MGARCFREANRRILGQTDPLCVVTLEQQVPYHVITTMKTTP